MEVLSQPSTEVDKAVLTLSDKIVPDTHTVFQTARIDSASDAAVVMSAEDGFEDIDHDHHRNREMSRSSSCSHPLMHREMPFRSGWLCNKEFRVADLKHFTTYRATREEVYYEGVS